jgi:hypothetical protein
MERSQPVLVRRWEMTGARYRKAEKSSSAGVAPWAAHSSLRPIMGPKISVKRGRSLAAKVM